MNSFENSRHSERGGAATKFLIILVVLVLAANAGYNYVPVAYSGANFQQEMDTAVLKGISAPTRSKPADVTLNYIKRAAADNDIPEDAFIEVKPSGSVIQARVVYSKEVDLLPFGLYKYKYNFDYVATPVGFITKQ